MKRINIFFCFLTLSLVTGCVSCNTGPAKTETVSATDTTVSFPVRIQESVIRKDSITKEDLQAFVIKGYEIMDHVVGDLNNDSLPDVLLVLHKPNGSEDPTNLEDYDMKRPLLLILGQKDGSLKLEKQNNNMVLCFHCGQMYGDAYVGITIEGNGKFTLHHYGGSRYRWTRTNEFQYSQKDHDWLLVKMDDKMEDMLGLDPLEEHPKTQKEFGRVTFAKMDNYK